ncbi:MAG: hypothetical protein E7425_04790 [Ruminococcaceae bacterium]|nr:hypothetical protein [Oscillospiraceae bacterium]
MKQKQTSKLLSVLLALCLIAGLLPWTAMPARAATSCNLWVGGTEVTSETTSGEGWAYAPDSHTLTLTNFIYSGPGYNNAAIYYNGNQNGNAPLTIELVGENSAAHTGGGISSCGIFVPKASLTITGSGTLTAVGGTATSGSCGIEVDGSDNVCADVNITGGTVEAKGGKGTGTSVNSYGIWAYMGNVSISGASTSVTATGDEASGNSYGIYANTNRSPQDCGSVSIDGSAVTATGGKATGSSKSSCGIFAVQGVSITNTGARKVTAAGGEAEYSYGIETENAAGVSIADSTVEAQGGAATADSYGIQAYKGNVSISGASTSVTATGGEAENDSYGIWTRRDGGGSVSITGGVVTAAGSKANGNSCGISASVSVSITGGTLEATGGAAEYSYGIYDGSVSLGGGTVTASSYSATVTVAEGFTYSDGENNNLTGTLNTAGLGGKTLTPVFEAVANGSCGAEGNEGGVTWTLTKNGGKVTVDGAERDALTLAISGTGAMADFEYSYGPTTAPWYAQNDDITTVTIGNGVTSIGKYAFYDCDNLKTVDLGGVTTIGGYAFGNCSLASLDLGNVTTIGDGAFSCCYMEELDLGGVTTIGDGAFEYCTSLNKLDLGSVVSIGSGAFYGCEELEGQSITIPASVTSIGGNPFGLCGLTWLGVAAENTAYRIDENGFLLSSDGKTLLFCPVDKAGPLTVPAGVETVCDDAFNGCTGLTGPVTIPAGVETIGNNAFNGCTGLTGSVTVPDSVTSIGNDAFYRCANIESIAVGSGIKAIGLYAFNNCSALKDIRIEGDSTDSSIAFSGGLFSGCNSLETVTLGDSVREIGGGAFIGCSSIKSIFVSRNTKITGGAFDGINNGKVYYYGGNTTYNISSWSMNPDNAKSYRILTVADSVANGTVTASGTTTPEDLAAKNCFLPGDTVTLTLTPDDGCSVDSVSYNDGSDHTLTPAVGVCSFTMPGDADVTVSAKWTRVPSLTNGKVTAPEGAALILAAYDESGRMTSVKRVTLAADCEDGDALTLLGVDSLPARCKLMLVDSTTYAPLCKAWVRSEQNS